MLEQLQMLNKILESKNFDLITLNSLTIDHFPNFKNEYSFIVNHFKTYNQVPDSETFIKVFPEFERIEVHESEKYLVDQLYKDKTQRFLTETYNKVGSLLMQGKVDEAMNLCITSTEKASSSRHLEAVNILNDISRYDEYVEKCNDFMKFYLSTGFKELDQLIGGYDRKEEYAVVMARSGVGKTWFMIKSITAAVERGLRVGVYEGEMSVNKLGYRFDTLMSHLSNGKIIHGNRDVAIDYKHYLENLRDNHKGELFVLTRDMIDGKATVDVLRSFIDKYKLDVLFVDQHSLLDSSGNERTAFERAAAISKDLKNLQVTKHIPIITVSQQNRSSIEDGKFAGTENVANSDRIAQDSTLILSLSQEDGVMTIYVSKARDGGTGTKIRYLVDLDKGKFEYLPDADESEESPNNFQSTVPNLTAASFDSGELPF